jgi:hypothetical protein
MTKIIFAVEKTHKKPLFADGILLRLTFQKYEDNFRTHSPQFSGSNRFLTGIHLGGEERAV